MSVAQMRDYVSKAYSGDKWKAKVAKMSDAQILAIYQSFLHNGKLK